MCGDSKKGGTENGYTREEVLCNICGIRDEEFLFYAPERIVKCRRCGLIYNNSRLDLPSRKKIYSKEYFVIDDNKRGVNYKAYSNYIEEEPVITRSMQLRMKRVESFARNKGCLLDIGCAAGFSILAAEKRGWEAEGVELSEFCVDYARSRGLKVHQGNLSDYPGKKESFDAITMWDYLEHSDDPLRDLKTCYSLLKKEGVVLLSIPNVDSWSFSLLKEKWIGFKNIEHFYYFSRETLSKLAHLAGLNLETTFYQGKYVSLSFFLSRVQYYVRIRPILAFVERLASSTTAKNIAFYFNPYDILNVTLRK